MGLRGLVDQVAVIVGGASGLGSATARRLGAEGCHVAVGDIAMDGAQRTADAIKDAGGQASAFTCDLSDPASIQALFATAVDHFGGVDTTFNVGSDMSTLPADTDVVDIDLDVWDRVMSVNLRGYVCAMKHAIPLMLEARRRSDREHVVDGGVPRGAGTPCLRHRQGRNRGPYPARRVTLGKGGNPMQCGRPRLHGHRDHQSRPLSGQIWRLPR